MPPDLTDRTALIRALHFALGQKVAKGDLQNMRATDLMKRERAKQAVAETLADYLLDIANRVDRDGRHTVLTDG